MRVSSLLWCGLSVAALAAVAALLLAAVLGGVGPLVESSPGSQPRPEAGQGPAFPRSAVDELGHVVTIEARPVRIVSNSVVADGILLEIVPPERILAVSVHSLNRRYSEVADLAARLGMVSSESAEVAVGLQPDLVFVGLHAQSDWVGLVERPGTAVYRLGRGAVTHADILETVRRIGYVTGCEARAEEVVRDFQQRWSRAVARGPSGSVTKPRVLGYSRPASYSYGEATLFHDVVTSLGAVNVGAEQGLVGYDGISAEDIAAWNPDWIVTGAAPGQGDALLRSLLAEPAVASTFAARAGQILVLPNATFLSVTHSAVELAEALADALRREQP